MLADQMEHKDILACGSGERESSSGSRTFPEGGEEDKVTATVDIKVSGDGEDGHNSDCESVSEVEGGGSAKYDEETPGGEESEEEDKDEKVNTTVGTDLTRIRHL